jgi:hypothetical protein
VVAKRHQNGANWVHLAIEEIELPSITLKGVPLKLYRELRRRAEAARRSLNGEVIWRLEQSVEVMEDPARDPEAFIMRVRERQARYGGHRISDAEIAVAKRRGRP